MSGGSSSGGGGGDGDDGDDLRRLPEDVWAEILVWLPVISLLRFKSVCNSWRSTIDDPEFIHRHAALEDKVETSILQGTITLGHFNAAPRFYFVSGEEFEVLEHLPVPPRFRVTDAGHPVNMVGSCHGIVCLHDPSPRDIALWNPTIKQFRIIPKSLIIDGAGRCVDDFVAFGFDVRRRDYKVLQITTYTHHHGGQFRSRIATGICTRRIQVYNLSTDSWRSIDDGNLTTECCTLPYHNNHGRYLNGKFITLGKNWVEKDVSCLGHTSVQRYHVNAILSFNFSEEMFETIQIPDEHKTPIQLAFLGEKIAFIKNVTETKTIDRVFGVWVLNENGEGYSWSKLYNIGPLQECPISLLKNGEFGLVRLLQLCNFATLEMKTYHVGENVAVHRADVYKRSLVSVRSSYYLS